MSRRHWSQDDVEKLKEMAGNIPRAKIAAELQRAPSALAVKAHQLGISLRLKGRSGTLGSGNTASQREPEQSARST